MPACFTTALLYAFLAVQLIGAPANDHFAGSELVQGELPIVVSGSNIDATLEPGEYFVDDMGGSSVWYRWTPAVSGTYFVACEGVDFNLTLAVCRGSSIGDVEVMDSSVRDSSRYRSVIFSGIAGEEYSVCVASESSDWNATAQGNFQLKLGEVERPANDEFANRELISGLGVVSGSTIGATMNDYESFHEDDVFSFHTVWYEWTAPHDGAFKIVSPGAHTIGIFSGGNPYRLTMLKYYASADDPEREFVFRGVAGRKYQINVVSEQGFQQDFAMEFSDAIAPVNDNVADATVVGGSLPIFVQGSMVNATYEMGEPDVNYQRPSIWYKWTAPETGIYDFSSAESPVRCGIHVYTGSGVSSLVSAVIAQDEREQNVTISAVRGKVYTIGIWGPDAGEISFTLGEHVPLLNDNFLDATVISSQVPVTVHGSNFNATKEEGEPEKSEGSSWSIVSVWYVWTAPKSGEFTLSFSETKEDGDLSSIYQIFKGESLEELVETRLVGDDTSEGWLGRFAAVEGQSYRIRYDHKYAEQGKFSFQIDYATENLPDDAPSGGELTFQQGHFSQLKNPDEPHVWTFAGEAGRSVSLSVSGTPHISPPRAENFHVLMEDPQGLRVVDAVVNEWDEFSHLLLTETGEYKVTITPDGERSLGHYAVYLYDSTPHISYVSIQTDTTYSGRVIDSFGVDWWRFRAKGGESLFFHFTSGHTLYQYIYLTGPDGSTTRISSSFGGLVLPVAGDYQLEFRAPHSGKITYKFSLRMEDIPQHVAQESVTAVREASGETRVTLHLKDLPVAYEKWVEIQSSTDLKTWTPLMKILPGRSNGSYDVGAYPDASRFFRAVPTSAPIINY